MKINSLLSALLMATSVAMTSFSITGCKKADEQQQQAKKYTCPHHPEVVQDTPGTCPKCNMALVEKK